MAAFVMYPNSLDGNTMGYWRFGQLAGQLAGVVGPTMVNHGGTDAGNGYSVTFSPNTYLQASFPSEPSHAAQTLEAWIRACATPSVGEEREVLYYANAGGDTWLDCQFYRAGTNDLRMRGRCVVGASSFVAEWADNAAIVALIASADPWHVAVVAEAGVKVRLYVNGLVKAEAAGAVATFPAMDGLLDIGCRYSGYGATAVVDEVRLSKVARYAAAFPIARLTSIGKVNGVSMQGGIAKINGVPIANVAKVDGVSNVS